MVVVSDTRAIVGNKEGWLSIGDGSMTVIDDEGEPMATKI